MTDFMECDRYGFTFYHSTTGYVGLDGCVPGTGAIAFSVDKFLIL